MSENRAPYGQAPVGPLAQKVESSIDPGQATSCIRLVVEVFPRQGLRDQALDQVTTLYSEFLESLHRMRPDNEDVFSYHDQQAA